jgi:hypothetical protein
VYDDKNFIITDEIIDEKWNKKFNEVIEEVKAQ